MAQNDLATAQGTTITFGTSGFTAKIRSIAAIGIERKVFDISNLGSSGYIEQMFGDLKTIPPIEVTFEFDDDDLPPIAAVELITFTFPGLHRLVGTAGLSGWTVPLNVDELMLGTYTVIFDGQTGPTWSEPA